MTQQIKDMNKSKLISEAVKKLEKIVLKYNSDPQGKYSGRVCAITTTMLKLLKKLLSSEISTAIDKAREEIRQTIVDYDQYYEGEEVRHAINNMKHDLVSTLITPKEAK